MTSKHYIALAAGLAAVRPDECESLARIRQWEACVNAVAKVCAADNHRFDDEKFRQATQA